MAVGAAAGDDAPGHATQSLPALLPWARRVKMGPAVAPAAVVDAHPPSWLLDATKYCPPPPLPTAPTAPTAPPPPGT